MLGAASVSDLPPAERGTAMMFQSYALFPHLSALDNVAFSLKMRGVAKAERRERARAHARLVVDMTPTPSACRRSSPAASSSASRSPAR